jgi:hypothetical protein
MEFFKMECDIYTIEKWVCERKQQPINSFARNPTQLACLTKEDATKHKIWRNARAGDFSPYV